MHAFGYTAFTCSELNQYGAHFSRMCHLIGGPGRLGTRACMRSQPAPGLSGSLCARRSCGAGVHETVGSRTTRPPCPTPLPALESYHVMKAVSYHHHAWYATSQECAHMCVRALTKRFSHHMRHLTDGSGLLGTREGTWIQPVPGPQGSLCARQPLQEGMEML